MDDRPEKGSRTGWVLAIYVVLQDVILTFGLRGCVGCMVGGTEQGGTCGDKVLCVLVSWSIAQSSGAATCLDSLEGV